MFTKLLHCKQCGCVHSFKVKKLDEVVDTEDYIVQVTSLICTLDETLVFSKRLYNLLKRSEDAIAA